MEVKKKKETAEALQELDKIEVLNLPAPTEKVAVPKVKVSLPKSKAKAKEDKMETN